MASSTASEIWSAILSGWPSDTDSEVNRKSLIFVSLKGKRRIEYQITLDLQRKKPMLPFVFRQLARLPLAWLHRARAALGWLVYPRSPTYAARLRENLFASGVCSGDEQCAALLRAVVAESGKAVTELAAIWFGPDDVVARMVVEC